NLLSKNIVWQLRFGKLSSSDMSELARNSVVQSGFAMTINLENDTLEEENSNGGKIFKIEILWFI
ncbi:25438_t:CDS:2, partial [Dentiscutata erythropus]